ncbi:MAG: hypothetical protein ACOX9C_04455 [Kiritimatiellia bacterium]|jgi:hypothetical protein
MATTERGNVEVRETWESRRRTRAEVDSATLVKEGRYADLAEQQPDKGMEIMPGWVVESSTLEPRKGLLGTLTINLVEKDASPAGAKPPGSINSAIEIDMAQIEKPLMAKSDYNGYETEIELWKASPPDVRGQLKYVEKEGEDPKPLTGQAETVARLMLKGVETYLVFAPVVTRTSTYKLRPDPSDIGKVCNPPVTVPGSWQYLKTGDRIVRQADGRYVRTEQWTGADEWAPELYGNA